MAGNFAVAHWGLRRPLSVGELVVCILNGISCDKAPYTSLVSAHSPTPQVSSSSQWAVLKTLLGPHGPLDLWCSKSMLNSRTFRNSLPGSTQPPPTPAPAPVPQGYLVALIAPSFSLTFSHSSCSHYPWDPKLSATAGFASHGLPGTHSCIFRNSMLSSTPSGLPSHLLGTPERFPRTSCSGASPQGPRLSATLMYRSPTPTFPLTFPALLSWTPVPNAIVHSKYTHSLLSAPPLTYSPTLLRTPLPYPIV